MIQSHLVQLKCRRRQYCDYQSRKSDPYTIKVEISLCKDAEMDSVLIVSIAEGGRFSSSELKAGQKILSINGRRCPKENVDAARIIAETSGTLAIEAGDLVEGDDALGICIEDNEEHHALEVSAIKGSDLSFMVMANIVDVVNSNYATVFENEDEPATEIEVTSRELDEFP
jgi:hypothetical protein